MQIYAYKSNEYMKKKYPFLTTRTRMTNSTVDCINLAAKWYLLTQSRDLKHSKPLICDCKVLRYNKSVIPRTINLKFINSYMTVVRLQ